MSPRPAVTLAVALLTLALPPAAAHAVEKKLLRAGWDEPNTAFLRRHIAQMQASPFDGCAYRVEYRKADGGTGNFTWEAWGRRTFTRAELMPALEDLRATRFGRFQHHFLRVVTSPADLDWFDDYSPVLENLRLAAWVAREGGSKGIWLDPEQYESRLFDFDRQRDARSKGWAAYAAQVRRRGREAMEALQRGYPDLTVFLSFGYSLPWRGSGAGRLRMAETQYGLLVPFLDGMIDAARGATRIVDGHELSYSSREPWQITAGQREVKQEVLAVVANPEKYRRVVSCGFGIWMDYDWRKHGWDTQRTAKNYRPPRTFERIVRKALETTDEYVWVYGEVPLWWTESGRPEKLPPEYATALRRARETTRAPARR